MVSAAPIYPVGCPCGYGTVLTGTTLAGIFHNRQLSATGAPWLMLVCHNCKAVRLVDRRVLGGATTVGRSDTSELAPFSFVARCDDKGCASRVELIAVRSADTTKAQLSVEMPSWKLDGIVCERGHQITELDLDSFRRLG